MSDLFENHIVGFPTRRFIITCICITSTHDLLILMVELVAQCDPNTNKITTISHSDVEKHMKICSHCF